jgi:hypothetical protein
MTTSNFSEKIQGSFLSEKYCWSLPLTALYYTNTGAEFHTAPYCISHVTRHITYDAYAEYRIYSKCGVNSDTSLQNFENLQ